MDEPKKLLTVEQNKELLELVREYIRMGKKYYSTGDVDYLPTWRVAREKMRVAHPEVTHFLENCTYFNIVDIHIVKILHMIDYVCYTSLEDTYYDN